MRFLSQQIIGRIVLCRIAQCSELFPSQGVNVVGIRVAVEITARMVVHSQRMPRLSIHHCHEGLATRILIAYHEAVLSREFGVDEVWPRRDPNQLNSLRRS